MKIITLGKTNLKVNKNGFGALPIQRISEKEAVYLLHKAYDNGINFYDTARFYTDSEEKIGVAFGDRRNKVLIASKTAATATTVRMWRWRPLSAIVMTHCNIRSLIFLLKRIRRLWRLASSTTWVSSA